MLNDTYANSVGLGFEALCTHKEGKRRIFLCSPGPHKCNEEGVVRSEKGVFATVGHMVGQNVTRADNSKAFKNLGGFMAEGESSHFRTQTVELDSNFRNFSRYALAAALASKPGARPYCLRPKIRSCARAGARA
jgi:hypothetical protein